MECKLCNYQKFINIKARAHIVMWTYVRLSFIIPLIYGRIQTYTEPVR